MSETHRHARNCARAIAKGQPLRISPDLERYFHESPREIFAAFAGVAGNMAPAGKDETLAFGYLFVLQGLLQELRYRMDRGYADATALVADFQAMVARRAGDSQLDGRVLSFTAGALQQAGIDVSDIQRLNHVILQAELDMVLCSGGLRGKQLTYALLDERAPRAKSLPRDAALALLTSRYFRSHGPATVKDYVWWSGLITADCRVGC